MRPSTDVIERLCALDAVGRGIARLVRPGTMAAAARSLRAARRVVLVTGFVPRPGLGAETDGPSGAVVLGRALCRLGSEVRYLGDPPVLPLLRACLRTLGEPADVVALPADPDAALHAAWGVVRRFAPDHLVAVERPGRAADGEYYNARGGTVTALHAPLDALFLEAARRVVTVGVGDGGNEIGMGAVRARVARDVPHGRRIGSVVGVHHLVVGGTSNWGAWGLVAHLGLLADRDLLHTTAEEARLTRAMVAAGGVDGLTGAPVPTVDGLPVGVHQGLLRTLRALVAYLGASRRRDGAGPGRREGDRAPQGRTTAWVTR